MAFILGIISGVVLLVFLFQNIEPTQGTFLAWTLTLNRGLFILILIVLGFIVGWVVRSLSRSPRARRDGG